MINTVIFDIGNVLVSFDWEPSLKSFGFPPEKYEAIANATYRNKDWTETDRGVLTHEECLARFISCAPQYAEDIRRVIGALGDTIRQHSYAKPLIQQLKNNGCRVYYLSNYSEYGYNVTKDELDFIPLMDGGVFSYKVKMVKPNPWIFAELFRRYDINPAEAVFLDDNADNIEAAKSMGLSTIHFTDYDKACKELKKLGVL
ncbi:MAG: HAD family phosphatase [Eubacteriales bacterium]|nr:HAD family phosphatase [Eubacteriales bacterium]